MEQMYQNHWASWITPINKENQWWWPKFPTCNCDWGAMAQTWKPAKPSITCSGFWIEMDAKLPGKKRKMKDRLWIKDKTRTRLLIRHMARCHMFCEERLRGTLLRSGKVDIKGWGENINFSDKALTKMELPVPGISPLHKQSPGSDTQTKRQSSLISQVCKSTQYDGASLGGPVLNTLAFQYRRWRFNPWTGNHDPTCHMVWPKKPQLYIHIYAYSIYISNMLYTYVYV